MIAIVNYGVGNLFSLESSLNFIGEEAVVTGDASVIMGAERIILPGVGAFRDAAEKLRATGLDKVLTAEAAKGKPLMGICLGMQLLFEKSLEYGEHEGLGLIEGVVRPIEGIVPSELKVPHIGWNRLIIKRKSPILREITDEDSVYFVHSYYADCPQEYHIADTEYGGILTAAVQKDNVFGCQFHPEKSGNAGLRILKAFGEVRV